MKETTPEIAAIAAKILKSPAYSKDAKKVAASCLSQRESDDSDRTLLIDHVREFLIEAERGGVSVGKWVEVFRGDLKAIDKEK